MNRVGVVTCQILELEFAHLLSHDRSVGEVWIIENAYSEILTESLERFNTKKIRKIKHPEAFNPAIRNKVAVLIQVNEVGLHSHIPNLKNETRSSVQAMSPFIDAVFLGYGLCGNAFKDMGDVFQDISIPVVITMDQDGPVDDCVGLIMGGRENYYAEQCICAGTMFMNAGFSKYCGKLISCDMPEKLKHKKNKIMQQLMAGYKRSLLLPTPVMGEKELRENSKDFNLKYKLKVESRPGTLDLLKKGWISALNTIK